MANCLVNMLLVSHTNLCKLNEGSDCDGNRGSPHLHASIAELNRNGADDLVSSVAVVLEDVDIPHIEKFNELGFKLVFVVVSPCLPYNLTDDLQLVPMAFFVIPSAHDLHSDPGVVVANAGGAIQNLGDFS
jgi:hypothetical protein